MCSQWQVEVARKHEATVKLKRRTRRATSVAGSLILGMAGYPGDRLEMVQCKLRNCRTRQVVARERAPA